MKKIHLVHGVAGHVTCIIHSLIHPFRMSNISISVDRGGRGDKDFNALTIEKVTEEELSQVEVLKSGRATVIEEVITRVEETEKEVIEEKSVGKLPSKELCKPRLGKRISHEYA